jgi:dipeptidyl aminopeptidase/acylaminoacyl peptidase
MSILVHLHISRDTMKTILLFALVIAVVAPAVRGQLPPIIDRDLFFGDPEISGAQISPDGAHITFLKPFKGVRNIWVKERNQSFDAARPITADTTRPIQQYFWSRDGKFVLYVQDKGGDENFRIYSVDPRQAGDPVPPSNDLTPMEKVRAMIIDVPKKSPNEILIGLNDRKAEVHDVYRLNIATGERTLIRTNDDNIAGWETDVDGNLRLGIRQTPEGGWEILRIDGDAVVPIYSVSSEENCYPVRFTPDGRKFYLASDKGVDKSQLQLFDLASGKTSLVEKDPKNEVDFGSAMFSDVTNELLATVYVGDRVRMYPRQKQFAADWQRATKALPAGDVSLVSQTADESIWVLTVSSDVDPGSRYLYVRKSGKSELLYRARPDLPSQNLAPMKPIRYKSRDGKTTIPAYLVTPKGIPAKNLPTVMLIHGGPWGRVQWGFSPEAQFLANRGYAVVIPNFRGSTGYGKKFLNLGNKQWGTGYMQHDITDGVKYIVSQGIADPKRVAIYGGSYGGYATLAGLAFTADLYAAGISYVGPSNIITLLNSIPPYWAPVKKMFAIRVGDLENPDDVKMLEAQSPLNFAKNIKAPLMVIQGANDPRVKKAESDQIVAAMRDLGRHVEYMVAPDEGHGFAGRNNRIAVYAAMEKFFANHLGGRYQESVPEEIQQKLNNLTVDVSTVTTPAASRASTAASVMTAFNGASVKPFTATFAVTMSAMGKEMTLSNTRTISEATVDGHKVWRIVEASMGMMGEGLDTLDVDGVSLLPIRRSVRQGMATVNASFSPSGVEGSIVAGPQTLPIHTKLASPVLSDGAGMEIAVASLPLASGYRGRIEVFDVMTAKSKSMVIAVGDVENVTTPAGDFRAFRVELTPTEGGENGSKLWISQDERQIVKSESHLPAQMGGGLIVSVRSK